MKYAIDVKLKRTVRF